MKHNDIDRKIREALRDEDAALYEGIAGEQALHEQILDLYRGQYRWLALSWTFLTLVLVAIAVIAAVHFYRAEEIGGMVFWGAICFACLGMILGVKMWGWMQMATNSVMREIKRLELQIANVSSTVAQLRKAEGDES
jgi:lipopolysaccharide export LptBFGC system permease protein LptF